MGNDQLASPTRPGGQPAPGPGSLAFPAPGQQITSRPDTACCRGLYRYATAGCSKDKLPGDFSASCGVNASKRLI